MFQPFYILLASLRILLIILSLIFFLIPYIIITKLFVENTPRLAFRIRRIWVSLAQFILGISVSVEGKQYDGNALYVSNHRSFSDPVIIAKYIDAYVIAKAEVGNLPLISTGAEMTGVMYVKRENKDSRSAVRELMTETLLEGKNVLVFPEGTTSDNFMPLPYKKGTFIEAAKNNIPIVPIVLEYKNKKDLWYNSGLVAHHFKQFGRLRTKAILKIGPQLTEKDGLVSVEKAESWTHDTIKEIHTKWNSHFVREH